MQKNHKDIRVRFAPSPTGLFHLGTARTSLFNYLFAKQNKGKFILRIEDTDLERSDKKFEKDILDNLKWLGLNWDEGPFYQTHRTEIYPAPQNITNTQSKTTNANLWCGVYQKYIKKLLDSGNAFYCSHTKEELTAEKKQQIERKQPPRHICSYFNQNKKTGIIRFRCSAKKIKFKDLIKGDMEFDAGLLGDIGIARDIEIPLYNLAVVIDDAEMKISHIIRGEDHLSNTPKQILLAQAFGFELPEYAHLPLILGPDKSKLSKRQAATSISDYKKEGYLPEALLNFMALLGWNPGTEKEIFSIDELIKEFSLQKIQKSGAVFNIKKLDWLNSQYIKKMDLDKLTEKCISYLPVSIYPQKKS